MSWSAWLLGRSLTGATIATAYDPGHKCVREVEVTAVGELTSWDGFTEKVASYGVPEASLWACLIRAVTPRKRLPSRRERW